MILKNKTKLHFTLFTLFTKLIMLVFTRNEQMCLEFKYEIQYNLCVKLSFIIIKFDQYKHSIFLESSKIGGNSFDIRMTGIVRASCSREAVAPTLAVSGERGRERERARRKERRSDYQKGEGERVYAFCVSRPPLFHPSAAGRSSPAARSARGTSK